jgi:hypothetical protein
LGQDRDGQQSAERRHAERAQARQAYKATAQEVQVEGIPKDATVTPVVVDFTVRTYYASEIQAVRRVREAVVYKDKMDDWSIMTGSVMGQDTTTREKP